jgi:hypothetical protein
LRFRELLEERAFFVVVRRESKWEETTMIGPGEELHLELGQTAEIVSWSGDHDKVVTTK